MNNTILLFYFLDDPLAKYEFQDISKLVYYTELYYIGCLLGFSVVLPQIALLRPLKAWLSS